MSGVPGVVIVTAAWLSWLHTCGPLPFQIVVGSPRTRILITSCTLLPLPCRVSVSFGWCFQISDFSLVSAIDSMHFGQGARSLPAHEAIPRCEKSQKSQKEQEVKAAASAVPRSIMLRVLQRGMRFSLEFRSEACGSLLSYSSHIPERS
jgi:hypothetical protein